MGLSASRFSSDGREGKGGCPIPVYSPGEASGSEGERHKLGYNVVRPQVPVAGLALDPSGNITIQ